MNPNSEQEEQAIEALVSAALHVYSRDVTEEEIEKFLDSNTELSPQGKAVLGRLAADPLADMSSAREGPASLELVGEFDAMHRSLSAEEMDDELKARLAQKREEILQRIKARRKRPE